MKKRNHLKLQKNHPSVITDHKKNKSIGFVSGLAFGTAVAIGAAFFYKTKKGQKLRKQLAGHYDDAIGYLSQILKDTKKHAKKLELDLEKSSQLVNKKTQKFKKRVKLQTQQTQQTVSTARRAFKQLGKPLLK